MKKNLANFGTALSRDQAKNVKGGNQEPVSELGNETVCTVCGPNHVMCGSYPSGSGCNGDTPGKIICGGITKGEC